MANSIFYSQKVKLKGLESCIKIIMRSAALQNPPGYSYCEKTSKT